MGNLVSLLEQELVDCDVNSGNQGCSGGFTKKAFSFIKDTGLSTGEDHPYKGSDGTCDADKLKTRAVNISGYEREYPSIMRKAYKPQLLTNPSMLQSMLAVMLFNSILYLHWSLWKYQPWSHRSRAMGKIVVKSTGL
ncbi:hypothetical protein ACFX2J_025171 [Malus domestica]